MGGYNYYLITALPTLGELGSEPPMTNAQLIEHLSSAPSPSDPVKALLLSDDLVQREALLGGEIKKSEPAVLTPQQLRDEEPLPEYLAVSGPAGGERAIPVDSLWEAYFRFAERIARTSRNVLLQEWVGYEVALRNALAVRRAETLQLDPGDYLVATDLADKNEDFITILNQWAGAVNPLAGMQVLDRARWEWLTVRDQWFSFRDEELTAYAAKLMLLQRWARLAAEIEESADQQNVE